MSGGSICPPFAFLLKVLRESLPEGRPVHTGTCTRDRYLMLPPGIPHQGSHCWGKPGKMSSIKNMDYMEITVHLCGFGASLTVLSVPPAILFCAYLIFTPVLVRSTLMYHTDLNWLPWISDKPSLLNCGPFCVMVHGPQSPGKMAWPANWGRICLRPTSRWNYSGHCNNETVAFGGHQVPLKNPPVSCKWLLWRLISIKTKET